MKRFLNCNASDFEKMTKSELIESIAASDGRIVVCETIGAVPQMLGDVTNAEFAASMGADIILINIFDVNNPVMHGLPADVKPEDYIRKIKELTGRPVGLNLEPLEEGVASTVETDEWAGLSSGRAGTLENAKKAVEKELTGRPVGLNLEPLEEGVASTVETDEWAGLSSGRAGTLENAKKAVEMGADFIVLTGNPGIGVTNKAITDTLKLYRKELGDSVVLIAGKMHAAGILGEAGEKIITRNDVREFAEAGADIILMPAPGSVPGITMEYIIGLVSYAHELGKLTLTSIGTSQEGADVSTIREIALMCKMAGTDLHHLGDSGYMGMALPENIFEYGKVIRGVRHTYHRIAASIKR